MNTKHKPKAIVVVTGIKLNESKRIFKAGIPATHINHDGIAHKMNAPAGVATVLNSQYLVYMVGYDQRQLDSLGKEMMPHEHHAKAVNLLDKQATAELAHDIADLQRTTGLDVHLVHYGGASDTETPLPNNSVFSHTWDIPGESIPELVANNCTTLLNISQALHKENIFDKQDVTKIIFVSAITAVRTKMMHGNDAAQKGAGHSLIRSMALDLTPEKIYITELMPGMTDTGFYDSDWTLQTLIKAAADMGYHYTPDTVPLFTAEVVGESVEYILGARGNVRELAVMPFGQYPHLGA